MNITDNLLNGEYDISVSVKTEKISGNLTIHIPLILAVHEVIMCINQLKGIYFPKVKEIVDLISCQTNEAIPLI